MPLCQLVRDPSLGLAGHLGLGDCMPPTGSGPSIHPITALNVVYAQLSIPVEVYIRWNIPGGVYT